MKNIADRASLLYAILNVGICRFAP